MENLITFKKCVWSVKTVLDSVLSNNLNKAAAKEARNSMNIITTVYVNKCIPVPKQSSIEILLNYAEVNVQAWQTLQQEYRDRLVKEAMEELQSIANKLLGEDEARRMMVVSEFDPLFAKTEDENSDQFPTWNNITSFTERVQSQTEISSSTVYVPPHVHINYKANLSADCPANAKQNATPKAGDLSIATSSGRKDLYRQNHLSQESMMTKTNRQHGKRDKDGQISDRQVQREKKTSSDRKATQESQEDVIKNKDKQIQDLSSRLSQMAGDKLKEGNPNISDLNDKNRPVKLAEQFSELYDNEWSDAFEELTKIGRLSEMKILHLLVKVLEAGIEFCRSTAEKQIQAIVGFLGDIMRNPDHPQTVWYEVQNQDQHKELFTAAVSNVKQAQRLTSAASIPWLKEGFKHKLETIMDRGYHGNMAIRNYSEKCVVLLWIMVSQDPPMHLEFCRAGDMRSEYFREYTKSGSKVVACAWPALFLYQGGPLMTKGVAALE